MPRRLRLLQVLAGVIPLAGAVLMLIGAGPADRSDSESLAFRVLVAGLIILGAIGFCLSMFATALLTAPWRQLPARKRFPRKKSCVRNVGTGKLACNVPLLIVVFYRRHHEGCPSDRFGRSPLACAALPKVR